MMDTQPFQALVVDDDPIARKMVGFALKQEGFGCAYAADGNEALDRIADQFFDLVVTDLRMPNRHGHSLAVELLSRPTRPLIVVHSSVEEPRLTKDLMLRGVDDFVFKPANYAAFAAKAAGMVERVRCKPPEANGAAAAGDKQETSATDDDGAASEEVVIGASELQTKLADVSKVLPISNAAVDLCDMVLTKTFNADQVAEALQQDDALVERILRLANTPFFNASGCEITDIKQAVVRIGQRRVGELALAMRTFASITPESLPWMDLDLAWRRSIAAGIAVELLVTQGRHSSISEGLLFSALMHNAGRIVLGTHYPGRYLKMVDLCRERSDALVSHEARVFPKNHAEVIAEMLHDWNMPAQLFEPLKHTRSDYPTLSKLPDPIRKKSELVRLAILIGQISVGAWEDWDSVDFPPTSVLDRLGIVDVQSVIDKTGLELRGLDNFRIHTSANRNTKFKVPYASTRVDYCNLSAERFDFLEKLLPSMGLVGCSSDASQGTLRGNVLINRMGAKPDKHTTQLLKDCEKVMFVRNRSNMKYAANANSNISVPCSFSSLRAACQKIARLS